MLVFLVFASLGLVDWTFFFALLFFIAAFGFTYSVFAIFMEVITYNQYKKQSEVFSLFLTALIEPFFFHPFVVWSAIKGNIDLARKKNAWGENDQAGICRSQCQCKVTVNNSTERCQQLKPFNLR